MAIRSPSDTRHSLTVLPRISLTAGVNLSRLPVAIIEPSGLKAIERIISPDPFRVAMWLRAGTLHNLMSLLPEAIMEPSGLKAIRRIRSLRSFRAAMHSPSDALHNLIVLSSLAEAINEPSGLKVTEPTVPP